MPNYDYRCLKCGYVYERFVSLNADADTQARAARCPECDSPAERLVSSPGIIFRGTGWTPKGNS